MLAMYSDLMKCKANPSTEFPKYIKKNFGVNKGFRIVKAQNGVPFITFQESEFKVGRTGKLKLLEDGITLVPFFKTTVVCGQKNRAYYVGQLRDLRDVTKEFIDKYIQFGMCSYTDSRHEFEQLTKRTRVCKYCGTKQVLKRVVEVNHQWENV